MNLLGHRVAALALFAVALSVAMLASGDDGELSVKISTDGQRVRVDAAFFVAAPPQQVWAVMTDFAHMAEFVSNLKTSRVLNSAGNTLSVAQAGEASYGPIRFPFESVREIMLTPYESVTSRSVSGTLKEFRGETRFLAEGAGTRVLYHSDAVASSWIPPLFGPGFIERETREQLTEMRAEVARRQRVAEAARRAP